MSGWELLLEKRIKEVRGAEGGREEGEGRKTKRKERNIIFHFSINTYVTPFSPSLPLSLPPSFPPSGKPAKRR